MNISYEDFNDAILRKLTVKKLKEILKDAGLVKDIKLTRKQDYVDFLVYQRDVVFKLKKQDIREKPLRELAVEKTVIYSQDQVIVGIDEAGCGSMAGGLYIGVAILPKHDDNPLWKYINDSKKLNKKLRQQLFDYIKEIAIEYVIHIVSPEEIDELNIWYAKLKGFHDALNKLKTPFNKIIIDGDVFRMYKDKNDYMYEHECVVKGDGIYKSIAAGSILAKHARDTEMIRLSEEFPEFKWDTNYGYCGLEAQALVKKHGITKHHRRTYSVCKPEYGIKDFKK